MEQRGNIIRDGTTWFVTTFGGRSPQGRVGHCLKSSQTTMCISRQSNLSEEDIY